VDPSGDGVGGLTATGLLCGSCGAQSSPTAKFCSECGMPLKQATQSAEYKQVTVLFADVVHSMDIAATVGPERLREIMTDLVNRAAVVVQRYGGTVGSFTGDGIMAVFGAPLALEDHAIRACLAALGIQEETARLAAEVKDRDDVELQLRVGLNSGQVIAGELGSRSLGYTTIGEQVGMAQRMESIAPSGGVMLSEPTARLVEGIATLAEPELVRIKGAAEPVIARRLIKIIAAHRHLDRDRSTLVGRDWELAALTAMLDRSIKGRGCVASVVGPAGIGKSRIVAETAAIAASRGAQVFSTYCESHTSEVPFHASRRLLRAALRVDELDDEVAREWVATEIAPPDPDDLILLQDALGIRDPAVELPPVDPDAARRRLTALVNTIALSRETAGVFVIEDAHWIDPTSESLLAEFLAVISRTRSLVLITHRPEYQGPLSRSPGAQAIALAPLDDSHTVALVTDLLGADSSVTELTAQIADRAAGNPFFAEEIVRDLVGRGVLTGERSAFKCALGAVDVDVPATLQAAIAARVDRLDASAKKTLNAAAVIGLRFGSELLASLVEQPVISELIKAELIDQVRFTPCAEYAFRHALIRAVAYGSQLKSDRATLHRRLASALEEQDPQSVDEQAALIAEHLEAAGDGHGAYGWHMRAAAWATNRDIAAARLSWERAQKIGDALPPDDPARAAMCIAPRTMLCGIAWRVHDHAARDRFDELRELCTAAGDKASLAIAMAGLVMDHVFQDRLREASQLASEAMALIDSVGDPTLTVGLSFAPIYAKGESTEWCDALRWSQGVIDLADGDPSKGNFIFGSPLAFALTTRGMARWSLGRPGWRDDLRHGVAMARSADHMSYATVVAFVYFPGISLGVLRPDDRAVREIEDAVQIAERSGDDLALDHAQVTLGLALVHRQTDAERDRGQKLLAEVAEVGLRLGHNLGDLPLINVYLALERVRRGDRDDAIPLLRATVDHLFREGQLLLWGIPATGVLVETLLDRRADVDLAEAEAAITRLAAAPTDDGLVIREVWLLRLHALLARAHADDTAYRDYRDRYRAMATSLGFEGHMKWAEEMP
jgi:class 3 adenylate cyclase